MCKSTLATLVMGRRRLGSSPAFDFETKGVDDWSTVDGQWAVEEMTGAPSGKKGYYYDRGRRQLATARVKASALGQWHAMRIVAIGDRIQAWLDGTRYLEHRDTRFKLGRVGHRLR